MALVLFLVIIALSISRISSQEYDLSVKAQKSSYEDEVIITGLVSPPSTLTLETGTSYLKLLKRNQKEKDEILQIYRIEKEFNAEHMNIRFLEIAPESNWFAWSPQELADQILAERVQFCKPFSVTFDDANNKVIIDGLTDPKPVIEFKKGDKIKLDGKEGIIDKVEFDKILFERQATAQMDITGNLDAVYNGIAAGKLQYKDKQGQWHQVDPVYEAMKPTEMDVAKGKYYKTHPKKGYPKKDEIRNWPPHEREDILDYAKKDNEKYRGVALLHNPTVKPELIHYGSDCTGALITPPKGVDGYFVLSDAHCFWDRKMIDPDHYLQPDPNFKKKNFKKWKSHIDQLSFQFGVLKQGKPGADIVDCGIEKVMIPKQYAEGNEYEDIAVVKLKGCTPPNHPFQHHEFIDSENEVRDKATQFPGTKYYSPGYGGRRTLQVAAWHLVNKALLHTTGRITCFGYGHPGDSGAPLLRKIIDEKGNVHYQIVGVVWGGGIPPTLSSEDTGFSLEDMEPKVTAITKTRFNLINDMMKGKDNANMEIKTFGARVVHYDDAQYESYDDYSLLDEARDNLVSAQMQFKVAKRLLKMKRKSRRYRHY